MLHSPNKKVTKLHVSQWELAAWQAGPKSLTEQRSVLTHGDRPFTTNGMPSTMSMNLQTAIKQQLHATLQDLITFYSRFSTKTRGNHWHVNGAVLFRTPQETRRF